MILSIFQSIKNLFTKKTVITDPSIERLKNTPLIHDLNTSDEEIWNVVTNYGQYREIWQVYRNCGLLEAIKRRDEKVEFDRKLSGKVNLHTISSPLSLNSLNPEINFNIQVKNNTSNLLHDLDLALLQGVASYFESMPDKILHYHKDHHSTREEATVIANYYSQMHNQLIQVRTKQDLEKIIQEMENLKKLVNRYRHESFKYRWSYGLGKNALDKLKSIK
jgi:hypothetical protein